MFENKNVFDFSAEERRIDQEEGKKIVDHLVQYLTGDFMNDYMIKKLMEKFAFGFSSGKNFCRYDADKFDIDTRSDNPPAYIKFLEKEVYKAGDDGLAIETPWNLHRRSKAKKK